MDLKNVESAMRNARCTLKSTPLHEMVKSARVWSSRRRPNDSARMVDISKSVW